MRSANAACARAGVVLALSLSAPAVSRTELRVFDALPDAYTYYDVSFQESQRVSVGNDGGVHFIPQDENGNPLPRRWLANGRVVDLGAGIDLATRFVGNVSADGRFHQLTAYDASGSASVEYRVDPNGNVRRVSPPGLPSAFVTAWSRGFRHAVGMGCDATHCAAFRWDAKRGARFLPHLDPDAPDASSQATAVVPDGTRTFGVSYAGGAPQFVGWDDRNAITPFAPPGEVSFSGMISRDGDVVVGDSCGPAGCSLYRWETGRGSTRIGSGFQAVALSDDGNAAVARDCEPSQPQRDCRLLHWEERRGFVALGSGYDARFVDSAGRFVLGTELTGGEHFTWDAERGRVELRLPGDVQGFLELVAPDAGVLAGRSCGALGCRAFRWSMARGIEEIRGPIAGETIAASSIQVSPNGDALIARWCDADTGRCRLAHWSEAAGAAREIPGMAFGQFWGDAVVGSLGGAPGELGGPALWDEANGTRPLHLPGHVSSRLTLAVRGAPALIGRSCDDAFACTAWLWTAGTGAQPLRETLEALGADVPRGLALENVVQSPDGRWLAGWDTQGPGVFRIDLAHLLDALAQP